MALQEWVESLGATPHSEEVPLHDAGGRVLATSVAARQDSPRFDNSQMDGYALSAEANRNHHRSFVAGPVLPAGTDPEVDYPRGLTGSTTACPLMTGSKIPEGTGVVVPVEQCDPPEFVGDGETVRIPRAPEGQFLRRAGSDVRRGEVLLDAGRTMNAQGIGILASQGMRTVEVWRRPRVLLCTGGEEISSDPNRALEAAHILDANGPLLEALSGIHGLDVVERIVTGDDAEVLRGRLDQAVERRRPDLVVTSGGISHGKFEVVRQVLEAAGESWFGHVAQQPGGPQGYGALAGVPVVALPGNPVSTLVSFRLFVAPLAARVWSATSEPVPFSAKVAEGIRGLPDKTQFRRGSMGIRDDAGLWVRAVGGAGSHLLAQSGTANCLIEVPPGAELATGALVRVHALTGDVPRDEEAS